MIRFGANPICWSNDDMPEIGAHISLEQCLNEARDIGFEGMELGIKFPRTAEALGPILKAKGLALVSGWYSTQLLVREVGAEMLAVAGHAGLLRALGSKVLIAAETSNAIHGRRDMPLTSRPVLATSRWPEFGRRMTAFAEQVLEIYGLRVVYHHHMGTVIQSEAEIDRLMEVTGEPFHLLLDTGHATWGGGDPARIARHYRQRISHLHVKDVREEVMWRSQRQDLSFLDSVLAGVYTVPGDGIVDFDRVLAELPGYSGWIVVEAEQDTNKIDARAYAELGFANTRRMIAEAGLT
ncbi:MAG: myo-inosose-2 dehydratase [Cucumibacter sp.]